MLRHLTIVNVGVVKKKIRILIIKQGLVFLQMRCKFAIRYYVKCFTWTEEFCLHLHDITFNISFLIF